ncbi:MAG: hypothetical protein WA853_16255, partial [Candidatus Acidiferrum sp.]
VVSLLLFTLAKKLAKVFFWISVAGHISEHGKPATVNATCAFALPTCVRVGASVTLKGSQ